MHPNNYFPNQAEMAEKMRIAAMMDRGSVLVGGTSAAYANDVAQQIKPQAALESAIDSLYRRLDEAFCAVDRLGERLGPVLQPETPCPVGAAAGNAMTAEPPRSLAVCRLHELRSQLEVLVNRVNGIHARLDT